VGYLVKDGPLNGWSSGRAALLCLGLTGIALGTFMSWMALGFVVGVPLLFGGVVALWLSSRGSAPRRTGLLAFLLAVGANLFIATTSVNLFYLPRGTSIRPMVWTALCFVVGLTCILFVIVLALHSAARERRYLWALLSLPLAVESLFLGGQLMFFAAKVGGLIIAD
jgi:hypothetical protein